jgi:exonuclease SbcC
MRILQIRFKNLNSLAGEWEIDLTHPSFAADGIFAITGPTGAGKSTILDALCLSLYGSTPRLGRITAGGNEIMSRQTGECFAEATFETQAGRYRCHWSQHRARGRADGNLQGPRHEIADAVSGAILETMLVAVGKRVEEVTGMDFDRFTRSMLLAQGGFAAFLQAAGDERAPILEQITGTEIYSRISIAVHERRSLERQKLQVLEQELAGLQPLTPEDERQLVDALRERTEQETEQTGQIGRYGQAIAWLDGIARLEVELRQLGMKKDDLQVRLEAFAPERERLRLAVRALELSGAYATLAQLRREQDADRHGLVASRELLPACREATTLAEHAMTAAAGLLAAKKAEQLQAQPLLRRVRELDLKIAEKDGPIRAAAKAIAGEEDALATLRAKQQADCVELDDRRLALEELLRQLDEAKADAGLVELLAGIRSRCEALQLLHRQAEEREGGIGEAEARCQQALRQWQEQAACRDAGQRKLEGVQAALAERQGQLLTLLEGRELADWRSSMAQLTGRRDLLAGVLEAVRARMRSEAAVAELDSRIAALRAGESVLTVRLKDRQERQSALEREMHLLESQLTLLAQIEDLQEARRHLQDGEPCPLCGAREHPFAAGNVPLADETRGRLAAVRDELKTASAAIAEIQVSLARTGRDLEHAAAARSEHAGQVIEAEQRIALACRDLPADAADPELELKLIGQQEDTGRELERIGRIVPTAEKLEQEIQVLRESLDAAKAEVVEADRGVQTALHRQETAGQALERLKTEFAELQDRLEHSLGLLRDELQPFGCEPPALDTLDLLLDQLARQRERWLTLQEDKAELDRRIAALTMQTHHKAERIRQLETELGRQREQHDGLRRQRDILVRDRQELFREGRPDDEEARLAGAVHAAEKELEAARKRTAAAGEELGRLNTKIEELEKAIGARDIRLRSSAEAFQAGIGEAGFADEENFVSACLPEAKRQDLARRLQQLADEETRLVSLEREKTALLVGEREKRLTDQPRDKIEQQQVQLIESQRQLQQEIGGIRHRLQENERIREGQRERLQAIANQQRECERWDLLHGLIGSADGKKYRNFAQGLTFEIVVGHANRQLRRMTDRYLLVRDERLPLDLNVIDGYQAGEIRSTRNLSGGESFIVSLALALGLSQMASRKVRIDSLFLDEGFGTLDEEALETALQTLAGLQQDGKLIGVISHVPALQERIATRIRVQSGPGGRSTIAGPGCRQVGGE